MTSVGRSHYLVRRRRALSLAAAAGVARFAGAPGGIALCSGLAALFGYAVFSHVGPPAGWWKRRGARAQ